MPHQMGEGVELRVAVGGQHFAVGIDVDALAFGLFQKLVKVLKIVPGNEDGLAPAVAQRHGRGHGVPKRPGVPGVEQFHGPQVGLAAAQDQIKPVLKAARVRGAVLGWHPRVKRLVDEGVQRRIALPEHGGVIRIGRYAFQTEEQQLHGRAHVGIVAQMIDARVRPPQRLKGGVDRGGAGIGIAAELAGQVLAPPDGFVGDVLKGGLIKIHVGQRGKKRPDREVVRFLIHNASGPALQRGTGQKAQRVDDPVLNIGYRSLLAAYAGNRAAGASGRLFALVAKHGNLPC